MGGTTFDTYGLGKTAREAFVACVLEAQYYHGHGGYSGTIAEKNDFVLFEFPRGVRCTVDKFIDLMHQMEDFQDPDWIATNLEWAKSAAQRSKIERDIRAEKKRQASFWKKNQAMAGMLKNAYQAYSDKWGPAVALKITGKKAIEIKKQRGRGGTHDNVYFFCGWASC